MKLFRLGVVLALLSLAPGLHAATASDLHGRWQGRWFVDEWFDAPTGAPIAGAALQVVDFTLDLHGFDGDGFGRLDLHDGGDGIGPGVVDAVSVSGDAVAIAIRYPALALGTTSAMLTGTLSGSGLAGRLDDAVVPVPGLVGWRGAVQMSLVPEPAAAGLLAAGLAGLALRVRHRRAQLPR